MDEQQAGVLGGGELEQLRAGGHAGGEVSDLVGPGYLQAVDAVVAEASGLKQAVELGEDVGRECGHLATISGAAGCVCG